MGEIPTQFPGFFKVFWPFESYEYLQIPRAFVAEMKHLMPKKATLRSCYGRFWQVEVTKVQKDMAFVDGWVKFVEDNSLEAGDFLVFEYDGHHTFHFILLGRTSCEKRVTEPLDFQVKEEEAMEEDKCKKKEEEEKEEGVDSEETETEPEEDEDEDEYHEEEDIDDDDDDDDDDEEEEEEEEEEEMEEEEEEEELIAETWRRKKTQKRKREDSGTCQIKTKRGTNSDRAKAAAKVDGKNAKVDGKNAKVAATEVDEEEDIFEYGVIPRPKNPYFVAKLRTKRRNELYVPADIIRDYDIKLPPRLMLLDQEDRQLHTKVIIWKDGRTWLTRGWKSFVKINNMKDEDRCICEFMLGKSQKHNIFLKMTVLRAGTWLPKQD